uniref:Uncharacterized protein n=1 Tax=Amphimedon queenslandica TaxID=400682 RepID=A0A1X7VGF8_AMPQE
SDISSIIEVRRYFDEPIKELRKHLDACDICPNKYYMTRSLHVEEINEVHEHDVCDNANVTIIVKKDQNNVEKYFQYSEIVCERIGHPIMCSNKDAEYIIDVSLADGNIAQLTDLKINEADETEFDNVHYALNDGEEYDPFRIPNLDTVLYLQYSDAIDEFNKLCLMRQLMHVVAVRGF